MKRLAKKTDAMFNQVFQSLFSGVNARSVGGGLVVSTHAMSGGGRPKSSDTKVLGVYFSRSNCGNVNYSSYCCCNNRYNQGEVR
ncbi:unknown [Fusobacterium sp. CAG:439]|nr:unknown [Fusobacterium sp. CAG:439]